MAVFATGTACHRMIYRSTTLPELVEDKKAHGEEMQAAPAPSKYWRWQLKQKTYHA
jgi:hypothetical protein